MKRRALVLSLVLSLANNAPADGLLIVDGAGRELLRCQHPAHYVAQLRAIECVPRPLFSNGFEGASHAP